MEHCIISTVSKLETGLINLKQDCRVHKLVCVYVSVCVIWPTFSLLCRCLCSLCDRISGL